MKIIINGMKHHLHYYKYNYGKLYGDRFSVNYDASILVTSISDSTNDKEGKTIIYNYNNSKWK